MAPFTTDGDLAIDPRILTPAPLLEVALDRANFRLAEGKIGIWEVAVDVEGISRIVSVDLLVPESLGGTGRRGARIPPHAKAVARKAAGLEATLVDRDLMTIGALDPDDGRHVELAVAGPSALIVAKVHKILDRAESGDRLSDKDALDVYRLLRTVPTAELARRIRILLEDDISRGATELALNEFRRLFGAATSIGSKMAARAVSSLENPETLSASVAVLAGDLVALLSRTSRWPA